VYTLSWVQGAKRVASVITWRIPLTVYEAARRLAREASTFRHRDANMVPKLNVTGDSSGAPTAWFICPDFDIPSEGIRKPYRSVYTLNDAWLPAAIVHKRSGFRCTWFDHRTRVISNSHAVVSPRDVIVVPEIYGPSICDLPSGVRQIIFNQNAYAMLRSLTSGRSAAAPYIVNPGSLEVPSTAGKSSPLIAKAKWRWPTC
jgi:hypothetical protein